jgi:UDP-glucose 4-epimerase
MKHYCLIGGAGFIGRQLAHYLHSRGKKISVIGRSEINEDIFPPGAAYFVGDYGNENFLLDVINDVDCVVNLAYSSVSKVSFDDPIKDVMLNLPRNNNLFESIGKTSVKRLVVVSSGGTIYGKTRVIPIPEDHPTNPISPYGITKLVIEKYALMYHELSDLPVICVRPSNVYGEGQKPYTGQGFIPTAIASVLDGKGITMFGQTGTIRDYIHVSDTVKGIVSAAEFGTLGDIYNIGTGEGKNNKEILEIISQHAKIAGLKVRINLMPPRSLDVPLNVLDTTRLESVSGWRPEISIEDGILRMWNSMVNR